MPVILEEAHIEKTINLKSVWDSVSPVSKKEGYEEKLCSRMLAQF